MGHLSKKIYIVHGWTYDVSKWDCFLADFKKLHFETLFLNVPGLTAPIDRPYTLDDYVEWLHEKLANETEPVALLGHSNGGRISIAYTLKYPEKVKNLILIGSAGVTQKDFLIVWKLAIFGFLAKVFHPLKKIQLLRTLLYKLLRERDYKEANQVMQKTMSNLVRIDLAPRLHEVAQPVLLIWGDKDGMTPLSSGKVMQKSFQNSELHILKNAMHSPFATHREAVLKIITEYYEKNNF